MAEVNKAGRVRPIYKGVWNASTDYGMLDVVTSTNKHAAYMALRTVPAGTRLNETSYWGKIVDAADGIIGNITQEASTADGGENKITVTMGDGTAKTFVVLNGKRGAQGPEGPQGPKGDAGATGSQGPQGKRGSSVFRITSGPSAYTTATGGFTPAYRVALSTVKNQGKTDDVVVGDTVIYSYYTYPVGYVDASYVYLGTRVSIRGSAGQDGTTPVKGTDYFTEADKAEMVEDVKNSIDGLDELLGSGATEATYTPDLYGNMSVSTGGLVNTSSTDVYHTDYLPLHGYSKIQAACNISSGAYAIAFFDASKNLMPAISVIGEGAGVTTAINMDVPDNAAYCMLSDYQYSGPTDAYITLIPTNGLLERMDRLEANANPLNGKTIAVLGDSISSVAYTVPNYWQLIADKTGCNFLDYGVSGSCFAVRSGSTTSFVERAQNMAEADAVLVMGGTNDAGKDITLGEWASTNNTTLYGALNELIATLRTKYPARPIIFCTPIKSMYEKDNGFPGTMADLKAASASTNLELWHCALAIKAKCAVHGIPVIDLYNESGIGSQLSMYFRTDDKLHPSDIGECRIANMVQPVLEQQFLYTAEYPEIPVEPDTGYTNLVPTSIDSDKSVYNGTGYKDGYRLSSSGGVSGTALSTATHTGFIKFTKGDTVRVIVPGALNGAGNYFNMYDASFAFVKSELLTGFTNNSYGTTETLSDGRVLITIFSDTLLVGIDTAVYFRISANPATGADMIVTINEEIN